CCALRKASCSESGNPIEAEGRIHGGGVLLIERPCASATSRHGLRSAECSQPQPRSMGNAECSVLVQARPPSRDRASRRRHSSCASRTRRAAAIPAAPPPMMTTSVSLLVVTLVLRRSEGEGRLLEQTLPHEHVSARSVSIANTLVAFASRPRAWQPCRP